MATAALIASAALMAAGTAVTIAGQKQAAQAQKDALERNAELVRSEQTVTKVEGILRERDIRQELRRTIGRQRVLSAKAGFVETGTPLVLADQAAYEAELEALSVRYGTALTLTRQEAQAREQGFLGEQVQQQGRLGSVATGLQGAGQLGMSFSRLSSTKAPSSTGPQTLVGSTKSNSASFRRPGPQA